MAITAAGVGSGLDIESLVSKLMQAERQPIVNLQRKEGSFNAKISAFGSLKSALSSLQTAASAISTQSSFATYKANVADPAVASAVASGSASIGSYALEVSSLAAQQKVISNTEASGFTFADGNLTLSSSLGSKTIAISAANGNNTMAQVRDEINAAKLGIGASLVTDAGGNTTLRLISSNPGTANAFTVAGLGLDFNPANIGGSGAQVNQGESAAASNAEFKLNGTSYVRSSNYVTNAIDGVALSLNQTNAGSTTTLAITQTNAKSTFTAYKATLSDTTVGTVSASAEASAASYKLEVTSLAAAQKVITSAQSANYTFAEGTLTLTSSTGSIDVDINSSNNTLSGVRDAINAANAGVTASLLNDGNGTRLIISSSKSGTDSAVTISGLGLDFNPAAIGSSGSLIDQTNSKAATNAVFKIDDIEVTRPSNVITDVLEGVTLNLSAKNENKPATLTVSQDTGAMTDKVNALITAYNAVITAMKNLTSYDDKTKTAAPLNGDATVRSIQAQLRSIVGGSVGGNGSLSRLADVGIKVAENGSLSLDNGKFQAVLGDPTKDVGALLAGNSSVSGFSDQIAKRVKSLLDTDGLISNRTAGLTKSVASTDLQIEKLEARIVTIEERYRRQFNAMDSAVASWKNTGSYLSSQFASLLTRYTNN